jgi:hypothetical protein
MSLKHHFKCFYCSKIYKNPIQLPCEDSICRHHLEDAKFFPENKISCPECQRVFVISDISLLPNTLLESLLREEKYLTYEEINIKRLIDVTIQNFLQLYDNFFQRNLELECLNHFQEIRFQIDLQREETPKVYSIQLLKKIDDLALDRITKGYSIQNQYLNILSAKLNTVLCSKSLNDEISELNEIFRNPNITLDDMQVILYEKEQAFSKLKEIDVILAKLFENKFMPYYSTENVFFGLLILKKP